MADLMMLRYLLRIAQAIEAENLTEEDILEMITGEGLIEGGVVFGIEDGKMHNDSNLKWTPPVHPSRGSFEVAGAVNAETAHIGEGPEVSGSPAVQIDGTLAISDGSGGIVSNSNALSRFRGKWVLANTLTTVLTVATTSNFEGAWIVNLNLEGSGTVANKIRLVQCAYNVNNVTTLGVDTSFGTIGGTTLAWTHSTSGFVLKITPPVACNAFVTVTPWYGYDNAALTITA